MVAAVRWAIERGAGRVIAAAPVGAREAVNLVRQEADVVVCLYTADDLGAVGLWYLDFLPVDDDHVAELLRAARETRPDSGRLMTARASGLGRVGDSVLLASSGHVSTSPDRRGRIVDVLGNPGHESYLVRWLDGRMSVLSPTAIQLAPKGRPHSCTSSARIEARRTSISFENGGAGRQRCPRFRPLPRLELHGAVDFNESYTLDGGDVFVEAALALGLPITC